MTGRRKSLIGTAAFLATCTFGAARRPAFAQDGLTEALGRLEAESGGRLGVTVLDTGSGTHVGHRGDERFPLCSTFKALLAAAVLRRVDEGRERFERRIRFGAEALLSYAPVTKTRVGSVGMTVAELCEAAVTLSDNTAANLLLDGLGGPGGLTAFVRTLGDAVTRLDRIEPDLNEALPGDPRDTTTPHAMATTLAALTLGDALLPASRALLVAWLVGCKTGDARLRAGLPPTWRVGDKTGSGSRGTANDVAVVWPERRPALVVATYLTGAAVDGTRQSAVIAAVGRAIARSIAA